MSVVAPGTPAPSFTLVTEDGARFTRRDLSGALTVLVFYPYAFSSVCSEQLSLYQEVLGELQAAGATLYGVSCDARYSQRAFARHLGVSIPQLSDFEPKGSACRAFGVLHPDGHPERALVVIDRDGVVRYSHQAATIEDLPGVNLLFDGLALAGAP